MIHVPYTSGAGQAVTDLVAGNVALGFTTLSSAIGQVQGGRLKGLAVTTAERLPVLPDIPTMAESGYSRFVSGSWQGLLAPAGTPPAIIARWHDITVAALRHPEVVQRYGTGGVTPVSSPSPDDFATLMVHEAERWGSVARRSGAIAD